MWHTLGQGEVALVCQRSMYQLGCISLVLIGVGELCIHHLQHTETYKWAPIRASFSSSLIRIHPDVYSFSLSQVATLWHPLLRQGHVNQCTHQQTHTHTHTYIYTYTNVRTSIHKCTHHMKWRGYLPFFRQCRSCFCHSQWPVLFTDRSNRVRTTSMEWMVSKMRAFCLSSNTCEEPSEEPEPCREGKMKVCAQRYMYMYHLIRDMRALPYYKQKTQWLCDQKYNTPPPIGPTVTSTGTLNPYHYIKGS